MAGPFVLLFLLRAVASAPGVGAAEVTATAAIATGNAPYAQRLRAWWTEGTAAGNLGDHYENRDGGHSLFRTSEFPQLTRWPSSDVAGSGGWGAATEVRSFVVVGNSSTAGSAPYGSSQGRRLISMPNGLAVLYRQYRANNLYIYPEHLDHDPGDGGSGGWGDLFPANTPYLIASQGSSGTDQPFIRAVVATLAAFRPETKRLLKDRGLLMPTVQMLMRLSATNMASAEDYFLSRAHPTVFDGSRLDLGKVVELAHEMKPDEAPPLVQLKVVGESTSRPGIDYFEPVPSERLGDTPGVIARLWRGTEATRRLVVSAEGSFDPNERPLQFRWVILRGDPADVTIRPLNERRSVVEIQVRWAGRRPVEPGSDLASSRQDIAAFVSNGVWWSAPGFVSWYGVDQELRDYGNDGRLRDVGYFAGSVVVEVADLTPFLDWIEREPATRESALARNVVGPDLLAEVRSTGAAIRAAEAVAAQRLAARDAAIVARNEATAAVKKAEDAARARGVDPATDPAVQAAKASLQEVQAAAAEAGRLHTAALAEATRVTTATRRRSVDAVRRWATDPSMTWTHSVPLMALWGEAPRPVRTALGQARERLETYGLTSRGSDWTFQSTFGGTNFTAFEANLLAEFNAKVIALLVKPGGITVRFVPNAADPILFAAKPWRDVYRHDDAGRLIGWTRFGPKARQDFTADGLWVTGRDELGRPLEAVQVQYELSRPASPNALPVLEANRTSRTYVYRYDGPDDRRGRPMENR